jgi:hypothetical protein
MAEDFLTAETATAPAEKKTRKRGPMSEAQKDKIRASNKAARERLNAQKAPQTPNVKTGITDAQAEAMERAVQLAAIKAEIAEAAISEDNRLMIHQEIVVDVFNKKRQYVELTPSMCRTRNCPFDAAIKAKTAGWHAAPINQLMPEGNTFGEQLIALREYHEATAHTVQQINDHIITASELAKRQWTIGQSISNEFLTGAK